MLPQISAFPNLSNYKSLLKNWPALSNSSSPQSSYLPSEDCPSVFINHSFPESKEYHSFSNKGEVEILLEVVKDLLDNNPNLTGKQIGIISPYAAQVGLIYETFRSNLAVWTRFFKSETNVPDPSSSGLYKKLMDKLSEIQVDTVDGFQGQEKEIIIFSTVRSNILGNLGFLKDKRRLNVALTRSKNGLFVLGNIETLRLGGTWIGNGSWSHKFEPDWIRKRDFGDVDIELVSGSEGAVWRDYVTWLEENRLVRDWVKKGGEVERVADEGRDVERRREREEIWEVFASY
jgi:superfamily I DNA and/or RNA helicase